MTTATDMPNWRRALVYGLGLSGRAAVRLLRARGVPVLAVDARAADDFAADDLAPLLADADVALRLGAEPADGDAVRWLQGVDALVASPGIPADRPLLAAARRVGVPVLAEVELAFTALDPGAGDVVVGITGSNGKSTTTALTGALLGAGGHDTRVCGNIGVPFAAAALEPGAAGRTFVVELSSFQLEGTRDLRADAAALLNLSPDHLDRHGDVAAYGRAKARIFLNQRPDDVAVLNADDPFAAQLAVPGRRRLFSRRGPVEDGCWLDRETVVETVPGMGSETLFAVDDLTLDGTHNLENAMAAALLARSRAVPPATIREGLRGFRGLPHRLERVRERGGVRWYDDSKGTNVGATLASLDGLEDGRVHLILGGRAKGAAFDALVPLAVRKARAVYLIGESAPAIREAFERAGSTVPLVLAETLERAVTAAAAAARAGEAVVLSPACASFDQFTSFVHRGQVFQRLVAALAPLPAPAPEVRHGA